MEPHGVGGAAQPHRLPAVSLLDHGADPQPTTVLSRPRHAASKNPAVACRDSFPRRNLVVALAVFRRRSESHTSLFTSVGLGSTVKTPPRCSLEASGKADSLPCPTGGVYHKGIPRSPDLTKTISNLLSSSLPTLHSCKALVFLSTPTGDTISQTPNAGCHSDLNIRVLMLRLLILLIIALSKYRFCSWYRRPY